MSVVDLATGKPRDGVAPETPKLKLLGALKHLVGRIEDGTFAPEGFYLIAHAGDEGMAVDSGLTVNEAITMLEREKFRILCMAEGVKL